MPCHKCGYTDAWLGVGHECAFLRSKGNALRRAFNITLEDYFAMLQTQHGVCAMCGEPPPFKQMLAVDHDHGCCPQDGRSCGRCVRALLCFKCNTDLGKFELFRLQAEKYLDEVAQRGAGWWRRS